MKLLQPTAVVPQSFATRLTRPGVIVAAYGLLMIGVAVPFCTRPTCEWEFCFVATSRILLAGQDIYAQPVTGYVYPPFQSLLAIPVQALSPLAAKLVWWAVNTALLWYVLRSAWRLAGGPDMLQPVPRREHLASALGLIVALTFFFNTLMHHQTDILLAALLFRGLELLDRGRGVPSAVLFGLAAAMKCTPLLFALYLLWRRQFLAAFVLVLVAVGASLLPNLIASPAEGGTWLGKWWSLFIVPMLSGERAPGVWASALIFNQSLSGAINRWSCTSFTLTGGFQIFAIEPRLTPGGMKAILALAALAMGAISAFTLRKATVAWGGSLVLCGMLLFSPMSSPAHFGVLTLPAFLLARAAMVDRSRSAGMFLALLIGLTLTANKDLLGGARYSAALWYGTVMGAALVALIGCWVQMAAAGKGRGLPRAEVNRPPAHG